MLNQHDSHVNLINGLSGFCCEMFQNRKKLDEFQHGINQVIRERSKSSAPSLASVYSLGQIQAPDGRLGLITGQFRERAPPTG